MRVLRTSPVCTAPGHVFSTGRTCFYEWAASFLWPPATSYSGWLCAQPNGNPEPRKESFSQWFFRANSPELFAKIRASYNDYSLKLIVEPLSMEMQYCGWYTGKGKRK